MKFYRRVRKTIENIAEYNIPLYGTNAAFYIMLSIFPALILVIALLPYIGYSEADLISILHGLIPSVMEPLIEKVIHDLSQSSSATLLSITAVLAVWSSSRGVYCIQIGLNAIYRQHESRNYFYRRLLCMFYMLLLIAALALTLILHGFGKVLTELCEKRDVPILQLFAKLLQFRELILVVILTTIFTAIYCVFPNRRQRIRSCLPGAALAAVGWLLFTYFFSLYVRYFNSYSKFYGSLSMIAIAMLWLYICISILFFGCVINQWLETLRAKRNGIS